MQQPDWHTAEERAGLDAITRAQVRRSRDGTVVTVSHPMAPPQPRLGYENKFMPQANEMTPLAARPQRMHLLGPGTGFESYEGLSYGEAHINQVVQNHGVENHARAMHNKYHGDDREVWITASLESKGGSGNDRYEMHRVSYRIELRDRNGKPQAASQHIEVTQNEAATQGPTRGRRTIDVSVSFAALSDNEERVQYVESEPGQFVTRAEFDRAQLANEAVPSEAPSKSPSEKRAVVHNEVAADRDLSPVRPAPRPSPTRGKSR